jgi:hypothetical protein
MMTEEWHSTRVGDRPPWRHAIPGIKLKTAKGMRESSSEIGGTIDLHEQERPPEGRPFC